MTQLESGSRLVNVVRDHPLGSQHAGLQLVFFTEVLPLSETKVCVVPF